MRRAAIVLLFALPAFAHGEQVIVFLYSFFLTACLGAAFLFVPWWRRWWDRLLVVLVLLATNLAIPFLFPTAAGELARISVPKAMTILIAVPLAAAAVARVVMEWAYRRRRHNHHTAAPTPENRNSGSMKRSIT